MIINTQPKLLGISSFYVSIFPTLLIIPLSAQSFFQSIVMVLLLIPFSIYTLPDFLSTFNILKKEKRYLSTLIILTLILSTESLSFSLLVNKEHDMVGLFMFIFMPTAFISFLVLKNDNRLNNLKQYITNKDNYNLVFCKICGATYLNISTSICQECRNSQLFIGNKLDYKIMLLSFFSHKYGFYVGIPLLLISVFLNYKILHVIAFVIVAIAFLSRLRNRNIYKIFGAHSLDKAYQSISESVRSKRPSNKFISFYSPIFTSLTVVLVMSVNFFGPMIAKYYASIKLEEISIGITNIITKDIKGLKYNQTLFNKNTKTILFILNENHELENSAIRLLVNKRACNIFKIDEIGINTINIYIEAKSEYIPVLSKTYHAKDCI